jgi:plasmid stability protein
MNQYDEIKKLLENSRNMLGKSKLDETREILQQKGIIQEAIIPNDPTNIDRDIEIDIDNETEPTKDKTQAYRVSGGILKMHGKDQKELELTTDEKVAFQETMDDFVEQVSDLSDFGVLNVYPNNVDWSGKVIDFDLEFYFTIGENSGVYVNGDMIKLDGELIELINNLTKFYESFKSKWAKVLASRKKTMPDTN